MSKTKFDDQIANVERGEDSSKSATTEEEVREEMLRDDARLSQGKKRIVHGAWVWLVRCMGYGAVALLFVVLWHLLAPENWRWLKQEEVDHLTTSFFSVLIGYMARSVQKFM